MLRPQEERMMALLVQRTEEKKLSWQDHSRGSHTGDRFRVTMGEVEILVGEDFGQHFLSIIRDGRAVYRIYDEDLLPPVFRAARWSARDGEKHLAAVMAFLESPGDKGSNYGC